MRIGNLSLKRLWQTLNILGFGIRKDNASVSLMLLMPLIYLHYKITVSDHFHTGWRGKWKVHCLLL